VGLLPWTWAHIHVSVAESDDWSGCPLLGRNDEVAAEFHDLVRAYGRLTFPLGK